MKTIAGEVDIGQRVLDLVRATAGDAVQAEVVVERQDLAFTRFASSYIHQNVADSTVAIRLRVHAEGRTAAVSSTVLDGLDDLAARALQSLRQAPADPSWPGLTPPGVEGHPGTPNEDTANATPAERAARVRAFVDAAGGMETAGYCSTSAIRMAYGNSLGHVLTGAATRATLDAIARCEAADGVARLTSPRLAEIDGAVLGARAAAKARAGTHPVELPPGRYEVVLEPTAVADVLQMLGFFGFNAKAVLDRQSFVQPGTAQFDPAVTIVDDATAADSAALPLDVEGTPRSRLTLVEAGVSKGLVHDRRTASRAGTESTGHAVRGGAKWGALPASLRLLPAGAAQAGTAQVAGGATEVDGPAADSSVAALVAGVERGLLVTDNHYTRVLDPRTLVVTGLTRNGVWLIEDGRITTPVRNFRFTQSYPEALAPGAVLAVGTHPIGLSGHWTDTGFVVPALRLASWNYTGGASG